MASKKYAYYNKGNKIALIQQDNTDASRTDYARYKSPIESVSEGIEIEYSYSPWHDIPPINLNNTSVVGIIGWTVIDGFVTFIEPFKDFAPDFPVGEYFYVASGPWAGIHKVQATNVITSAKGGLQTFTKANISVKLLEEPIVDVTAGGGIYKYESVSNLFESFNSATEPYLWITGHSTVANNSFYSGWTYDKDDDELFVTKQHVVDLVGSKFEELVTNPTMTTSSNDLTISIREAFKSLTHIVAPAAVSVMEDESFDIDLNNYQSNAIVLYLKAKNAEDQGDMERFEYYMNRFRMQLGKFRGSQKYGPYIIQGNRNMLK
tara:strand:- start:9216 stop:10175 length:960 start_codon:yes stop_codon:yes gene_type:complete